MPDKSLLEKLTTEEIQAAVDKRLITDDGAEHLETTPQEAAYNYIAAPKFRVTVRTPPPPEKP